MSLYKTPTFHFLLTQPAYLSVFPIAENTRITYFYIQNTTNHLPPFFFRPDAGLPSGGTGRHFWFGPNQNCIIMVSLLGFQRFSIANGNPDSGLKWK